MKLPNGIINHVSTCTVIKDFSPVIRRRLQPPINLINRIAPNGEERKDDLPYFYIKYGGGGGEWNRTTDLQVIQCPLGMSKDPESVLFVRRVLQTLAIVSSAGVSQIDEH
ncbi:MAG: hypothetical protein IH585_19095 [Anaerolineaceae bacterium]|nr:hypothetical protein [Anaerolineaceae bacterium]